MNQENFSPNVMQSLDIKPTGGIKSTDPNDLGFILDSGCVP